MRKSIYAMFVVLNNLPNLSKMDLITTKNNNNNNNNNTSDGKSMWSLRHNIIYNIIIIESRAVNWPNWWTHSASDDDGSAMDRTQDH